MEHRNEGGLPAGIHSCMGSHLTRLKCMIHAPTPQLSLHLPFNQATTYYLLAKRCLRKHSQSAGKCFVTEFGLEVDPV